MTGHNGNARPVLRKPGPPPGTRAWNSVRPAGTGGHDSQPGQEVPAATQARKPWLLPVAGAAATAVPAGPGLALAAAGHPGAVPLLIASGVIGLVSVIAGTAVKIYNSAQRTRHLQIQHEGATAIATAMARCIDAAHAGASGLPVRQGAAEAAEVRASAMQMVTEMMPAMIAVIEQQTLAPDDLDGGAPGRQLPAGNLEKSA